MELSQTSSVWGNRDSLLEVCGNTRRVDAKTSIETRDESVCLAVRFASQHFPKDSKAFRWRSERVAWPEDCGDQTERYKHSVVVTQVQPGQLTTVSRRSESCPGANADLGMRYCFKR